VSCAKAPMQNLRARQQPYSLQSCCRADVGAGRGTEEPGHGGQQPVRCGGGQPRGVLFQGDAPRAAQRPAVTRSPGGQLAGVCVIRALPVEQSVAALNHAKQH
jgi:hypothetical protein